MAADPWATPPTPEELKGDPWATPPTAQEMGTPPVQQDPSKAPPSTLDILQKGAEWLSGLGAGSRARILTEHPERAKEAEMINRLSGFMIPTAARGMRSVAPQALDPVLQPTQNTNPLPALPKLMEKVPVAGRAVEVYNTLRPLAQRTPEPYINPYPPTGKPTFQPPRPAPAPDPLAAPEAPANIYEMAGRTKKVTELTKAIDANASAHLGVDPMDPRFADALESLPQQWWEGMAQVAKINKPSPETVKQAVEFFRDRAAQAATAQSGSVQTGQLSWKEFTAQNMGEYMKKYGGHGPAMKELSKAYRAAGQTPK